MRERRAVRFVLALGVAVTMAGCHRAPPGDLATPPATDAAAGGGVTCESLTALALPHVTITEARSVAADAKTKTPAHCRVLGTSKPTADSDIRFVVAIPAGAAWNGRYEQVGSGGFAGFLPDDGTLREALGRGYAVAGTDDGHQAAGNDARWARGHREKLVDYGWRALKETTDAARAVVRAFTGRGPTRSYFAGCSDGGREALMEAQRFPGDFDGILAMAPGNDWTHLMSAMAWNVLAVDRAGLLGAAKLPSIQAAARKACADAEGIVEDPTGCHFDPASLRCRGPETDACLTDAQVAAVRAIYDGPTSPRTGERIYPGTVPGVEAETGGWSEWRTGRSREGAAGVEDRMLATGFFQSMLFGDPSFDIHRLDFDRDVARARAELGPVLDANDPDLHRFAAHAKLIVLHGWSDPGIPARASIDYFERVQRTMGDPRAFYRLFLAPGMLHCEGGPGPDSTDSLGALEAWVERGVAPDSILATKHPDGDSAKPPVRAWPLCPYPQRATWDGQGDRAQSTSWRCTSP